MFYSRLEEAFEINTDLDPASPEGKILMAQYFISQSTLDITRKVQKLQMGPQINQNQFLDTTFMVYNNCELEEGKGDQSKKKTASQNYGSYHS